MFLIIRAHQCPGTKLLQEDGKINESLFSDGLHPNEEGYKRIVDEIAH